MTYAEAQAAMKARTLVCAGEGDDYDEGYIVDLETKATAFIAWKSGVRTPCAVADLAAA